MAFEALPSEMRACPQWICWRYQWDAARNKWTKVPLSALTGRLAATDRPTDWTTFDRVYAYAAQYQLGLGFVFGHASGLAGLDLDNVLDERGNVLVHEYVALADRFNTYTELSPSGTGLHSIFAADVPQGRRHAGVELYGQGRFFTVTGNSYGAPRPIAQRQVEANQLLADIDRVRGAKAATSHLVEWGKAPKYTLDQVWQMATTATNSERFNALWAGNWRGMYTSQSEADFALVDMLAHWTNYNAEQTQYMFTCAPSYRPEKYANRRELVLGMIQRAWDKYIPPVDIPPLPQQQQQQEQQPAEAMPSMPAAEDHSDEGFSAEELAEQSDDPYTMPPGGGMVADIAQFIYQQAPFPIKEAALAAALGMMGGICGRQFQFAGKGLNLYLFLLAHTGAGKEAMSTGIGKLFDAVCNPRNPIDRPPSTADVGFPSARDFRGPARLTGKGAMIALSRSQTLSFVSIMSEFAYTLEKMKEGARDVGAQQFREALLLLYQVSAQGNTFAGYQTSDKDTSIKPIASPALTLLAESTPGKFYQFLDEDMVTSGLLPRCIVIETDTFEEHMNTRHHEVVPSDALVAQLTALCKQVLDMRVTHDIRMQVQYGEGVAEASYAYQLYTRKRMNRRNEAADELWNRAHQNAERIAALVAIGQNPYQPVVSLDVFRWAARITHRQTVLLVGKFKRGEVGVTAKYDEHNQLEQLRSIVARFKAYDPHNMPKSYAKYADYRAAGYVPYSYLQVSIKQLAVFTKDSRGPLNALAAIVKSLQQSGELGSTQPGNRGGTLYQLV